MGKIRFFLIWGLIFFFGVTQAFGETIKTEKATLVDFSGDVKVNINGKWVSPSYNLEIGENAQIKTGEKSYCMLLLADGSTVKMGENTHIQILKTQSSPTGFTHKLKLKIGNIWNTVHHIVGKKTTFEVENPNTLAAVKGTVFEVRSDGKTDDFLVYDGEVLVKSFTGKKFFLKKDYQMTWGRKGPLGAVRKINRKKLNRWQIWNLMVDKKIALLRQKWKRKGFPKNKAQRMLAIRKALKSTKNPYTRKKITNKIKQSQRSAIRKKIIKNLKKDFRNRIDKK